jgi:hypothetical protein
MVKTEEQLLKHRSIVYFIQLGREMIKRKEQFLKIDQELNFLK